MTKIYLISAVESEGRIYRVVQGWSEGNITSKGREQARALAGRLRNVPLDNVYSSDLFIARLTAKAVCAGRQLSCHTDSGLRELCFGVWEGMSLGNISYEMPEQLEHFRTALHRWKVEDAESPEQVQRRMLTALEKIAGENEGELWR